MLKNRFDIRGKKAIVTGGTRGLGKSMAEALLEEGCEVVIVGSSEGVFRTAEGFCARGLACHAVRADLASREETLGCFRACMERLGNDLDILVNAHGIQRRHMPEEFPLSDWDDVINVNLNAVFVLCQEAGRVMLPKGRGKIINIASMISFFGGQTIPAYAAAKGGVAQLTKALSNDWAGSGTQVNAIAPGYMATDMNAALLDPANPRFQQISDRIPAHRWGTGEDMKGACVFLASPASDYITGVVLPVDGGYLVK